jgi:DNA polymerase elongation subunit (family B)
VKPNIFVTFHGDAFDWPFLEARFKRHGISLYDSIGVKVYISTNDSIIPLTFQIVEENIQCFDTFFVCCVVFYSVILQENIIAVDMHPILMYFDGFKEILIFLMEAMASK